MIIAPSILSANFGNLAESIEQVKNAEWLHIDVMDGHFVPNITIGPMVVKGLRPYTSQVFDTHLMIKDPKKYAKEFVDAGSDRITFHIEAIDDPKETIAYLKSLKVRVGVSIKPDTPVAKIAPYLPMLDQVLVMSVEPGFGGQEFIMKSVLKIEELDRIRKKDSLSFLIAVDGGINKETAVFCKKAGADVLIAGSYIFKSDHPNVKVDSLK
jgi:ribulose-phosphate 3-epimerase